MCNDANFTDRFCALTPHHRRAQQPNITTIQVAAVGDTSGLWRRRLRTTQMAAVDPLYGRICIG